MSFCSQCPLSLSPNLSPSAALVRSPCSTVPFLFCAPSSFQPPVRSSSAQLVSSPPLSPQLVHDIIIIIPLHVHPVRNVNTERPGTDSGVLESAIGDVAAPSRGPERKSGARSLRPSRPASSTLVPLSTRRALSGAALQLEIFQHSPQTLFFRWPVSAKLSRFHLVACHLALQPRAPSAEVRCTTLRVLPRAPRRLAAAPPPSRCFLCVFRCSSFANGEKFSRSTPASVLTRPRQAQFVRPRQRPPPQRTRTSGPSPSQRPWPNELCLLR